jgi:hypothetical protein
LTATFDPDTLLSSNNIGIQLLRSGGKLVGQLLRGAAAIGPGLINIVGNAIKGVADWFTGTNSEEAFGPSFKNILMNLFDLNASDLDAIFNNFEAMFKTLFEKILPSIARIGNAMYLKLLPFITEFAFNIGSNVFSGVIKGIISSLVNNWKKILLGIGAGLLAFFTGGLSLIPSLIIGGLTVGGSSVAEDMMASKQSANDAASDMFSGRTTALMQRGSSGYNITNFADGDQVVAGMPKGPIVEGIRYSGNVAAGLSKLIRSNMEAGQEGRSSGVANQRPIEVILTLDSEVVARQLLSEADLIGKAGRLEYTRGSTRLQSRAMVNPTGGSTEASSLG